MANDKPDFVDMKGVEYFVSMTSDGLCVHARAPEGWRVTLEYDPNCANEGWVKAKLSPGVIPRPLRRR